MSDGSVFAALAVLCRTVGACRQKVLPACVIALLTKDNNDPRERVYVDKRDDFVDEA